MWLECNGIEFTCEQVLYYTDTPEIFICIDQNKDRYIIVFEDDNLYLVTPISLSSIVSLVKRNITVYDCILAQSCSYVLYYAGGYHMKKEVLKGDRLDLLPDPDVYLDVSKSTVTYYQKCLNSEKLVTSIGTKAEPWTGFVSSLLRGENNLNKNKLYWEDMTYAKH